MRLVEDVGTGARRSEIGVKALASPGGLDDQDRLVEELPRDDPEGFAWRVIGSCWSGDRETFESTHAPYSVLHRSPFRHYSGRKDVFEYYQHLRDVVGDARFSVDHVASQPFSDNGIDIAVRWSAAGYHQAEVSGVKATGKPMFILGVTHWRCITDHVAIESTIFDDLAVLSQTMVEG